MTDSSLISRAFIPPCILSSGARRLGLPLSDRTPDGSGWNPRRIFFKFKKLAAIVVPIVRPPLPAGLTPQIIGSLRMLPFVMHRRGSAGSSACTRLAQTNNRRQRKRRSILTRRGVDPKFTNCRFITGLS
jgi:hypothetical protein